MSKILDEEFELGYSVKCLFSLDVLLAVDTLYQCHWLYLLIDLAFCYL